MRLAWSALKDPPPATLTLGIRVSTHKQNFSPNYLVVSKLPWTGFRPGVQQLRPTFPSAFFSLPCPPAQLLWTWSAFLVNVDKGATRKKPKSQKKYFRKIVQTLITFIMHPWDCYFWIAFGAGSSLKEIQLHPLKDLIFRDNEYLLYKIGIWPIE